jgi:DNA-binding NarL/FixJ family response regulator
MSNEPIRIILVDNHELVRESWKLLLERNPRFKILGVHTNGPDAINHVATEPPDIMLVDINMTPVTGFEVTEDVMRIAPHVKVIAISVHNMPRYAKRILELGGRGYLTKTSTLPEIYEAITEVAKGNVYICEEVKEMMKRETLQKREAGR